MPPALKREQALQKEKEKNPVFTQNPESMFLTSPPLVKETDMVCNRQKQRRLPYSLATSRKPTLAVQSPGINSQPGGPVRQPYLPYYWPARPHRFLGIDFWAP
jgi:hypothetical protein